jgi:hypothetical protein
MALLADTEGRTSRKNEVCDTCEVGNALRWERYFKETAAQANELTKHY